MAAQWNPPFPRPPRSFPTTTAGLDGLWHLLCLVRALTVVQRSPPAMADALVSAGLLPALAALLGRWESFRAATAAPPDAASRGPPLHWNFYVIELIGVVMGLVGRHPELRRQVCVGGGEGKRGKGRGRLPFRGGLAIWGFKSPWKKKEEDHSGR